jgi:hypothetical protein
VASDISWKDQFLWVANRRLTGLMAFALQVGGEAARSDSERGWVGNLRRFDEQAWPGIGFDLDERFPNVEEKKFWARVFHDVARRIFLRQLGNQEVTFWQSSAIGDAYVIARMLTRAVQEVENAWHPDTENRREGEEYESGRINVQL